MNRRIEELPELPPAAARFPHYRVSMPVEHLVAGVKRASLLGQSSSPVRFDINIASQTTQLVVRGPGRGLGAGDHCVLRRGRDVEIAFNYAYLLDGLAPWEPTRCSWRCSRR